MTATAIAVAFVVFSCKGKLARTDSKLKEDTPVQTVRNMFIVQTQNGGLQMRMEADLMERYDKDTVSYELFPEGIAVYGYDEEGRFETEIVADNARHMTYKDGRESWQAFGNVVVKNHIKSEVMETDTLYWDQKNEKLYTNCYVRIYSPDGFLQGYGMESDQRARNSVLLKPFNSYAIVVQDSTDVLIDSANFIGPLQKK
ncbi:MAG: LPS export ABC transporter periplasmic protein LptC [Bacteroidales bacterium]|nr:LPS export ABC transporter periplasmic protein LptC [Bacteroidales bacterium]MDD5891613.1 LPS export ABC transporter periplasmic protein LptC [Bacteroidales bacterium]MDY5357430.1 LPS export ABC transporter periplasmic protein LptC [Candidatus Cryptobacteroides sp.]